MAVIHFTIGTGITALYLKADKEDNNSIGFPIIRL
jgi:hypothetical protein